MAIDYVCGLDVDEWQTEKAGLTSEYNGRVFHFCSQDCKRMFDKEPQQFAPTAQDSAEEGGMFAGD
jgi:YHS domain-containing protein